MDQNPYAPPVASIDAPPAGSAAVAEAFARQSVWLMVLLSIPTLGLSLNHWLYQRSRALNAALGRDDAAGAWFVVAYVVAVASAMLTVAVIVSEGPSWVVEASTICDRIDRFLLVVTSFGLRKRLNVFHAEGPDSRQWFNGVATFFFGPLYFQWKFNRVSYAPAEATTGAFAAGGGLG